MRRYGMLSSPVSFLAGAFFLATVCPVRAVVLGILSLGWVVIESRIARTQVFLNQVPSSPWIMVSRVAWLGSVAFTIVDACRKGCTTDCLMFFSGILMASALCFRLKAFSDLGKSFTYDVRADKGIPLVTNGLYSHVRHPAYLAICVLGTVPALIAGSPAGFLFLVLCTVPQTVYRLELEEKVLEAAYGSSYAEYRSKTYKMIPFVY